MSEKSPNESLPLPQKPTWIERRDPSDSEKRGEPVRKVPESLREALGKAMDVAISRVMARIVSKEGMSTDARAYRNETVAVLKEMDARLPEGHVLKGTSDLIVENFLTPEARWAELIRSVMEKGFALKEGKGLSAGPKEYDEGLAIIRSALGFSLDLAQKQPRKIAEFVGEIKKLPEAAKILERFPDLETLLLKILPEIAKNVDKKAFLEAFDTFAKGSRDAAITILEGKATEREIGDAAMKFANESSKLLSSTLNAETVRAAVDGIASLSVVRSHPTLSRLADIVKRPELSDADRLALVTKANEGILLFTKIPPNETELEKYANSLAELLSGLSRRLPKELVTDTVESLVSGTKGESGGKELKIKSVSELATLLYENRAKIPEALRRYFTGELSTVRDIVRFFVDERLLEDNLAFSKGELVGRMKRVVEIDLVSFSGLLRGKLSSAMVKPAEKTEVPAEKTANVRDVLSEKVLSEMMRTFFGPDRPARITKEFLADRVSAAAVKAVDSMPGTTVKIGGADIPKSALKNALASVEFRLFAADAFAKVAGEVGSGWSGMEKVANIVAEIMKDPLGNRYTGERTRTFAIDAFYALPASEIAETVASNLESSKIGEYLKKPDGTPAFDKRDVVEMVNILRDGEILPKETLSKLLSKENLSPPVDAAKILRQLLDSLSREQLSLLVEKICARRPDGSESLLEKWLSIRPRKGGSAVSESEIPNLVWLVFDAVGKLDSSSRQTLFERLGTNVAAAEYGVSFFAAFGKERVLMLAKSHPSTFVEIVSGRVDPRKNPEKLIPLAVDIAYASDFSTDSKLLSEAKKAFPEIRGFLSVRIFWESVETSISKIREAVPRERLRDFLLSHSAELSSLSQNFDTARAAKIWAEFLFSIDEDKLPSLVDPSKLSGAERLAAEKLPQIRKALDSFRNETVTDPDGRQVSRLDALIESGIRLREGRLSQKETEFFAGETFDLLSRLLPTMGDWKIPESGGETPESGKRFKKEFLSHNFGFALSQALPYLFGRPTEKIVENYFADSQNRQAFVKTLSAAVARA